MLHKISCNQYSKLNNVGILWKFAPLKPRLWMPGQLNYEHVDPGSLYTWTLGAWTRGTWVMGTWNLDVLSLEKLLELSSIYSIFVRTCWLQLSVLKHKARNTHIFIFVNTDNLEIYQALPWKVFPANFLGFLTHFGVSVTATGLEPTTT